MFRKLIVTIIATLSLFAGMLAISAPAAEACFWDCPPPNNNQITCSWYYNQRAGTLYYTCFRNI